MNAEKILKNTKEIHNNEDEDFEDYVSSFNIPTYADKETDTIDLLKLQIKNANKELEELGYKISKEIKEEKISKKYEKLFANTHAIASKYNLKLSPRGFDVINNSIFVAETNNKDGYTVAKKFNTFGSLSAKQVNTVTLEEEGDVLVITMRYDQEKYKIRKFSIKTAPKISEEDKQFLFKNDYFDYSGFKINKVGIEPFSENKIKIILYSKSGEKQIIIKDKNYDLKELRHLTSNEKNQKLEKLRLSKEKNIITILEKDHKNTEILKKFNIQILNGKLSFINPNKHLVALYKNNTYKKITLNNILNSLEIKNKEISLSESGNTLRIKSNNFDHTFKLIENIPKKYTELYKNYKTEILNKNVKIYDRKTEKYNKITDVKFSPISEKELKISFVLNNGEKIKKKVSLGKTIDINSLNATIDGKETLLFTNAKKQKKVDKIWKAIDGGEIYRKLVFSTHPYNNPRSNITIDMWRDETLVKEFGELPTRDKHSIISLLKIPNDWGNPINEMQELLKSKNSKKMMKMLRDTFIRCPNALEEYKNILLKYVTNNVAGKTVQGIVNGLPETLTIETAKSFKKAAEGEPWNALKLWWKYG